MDADVFQHLTIKFKIIIEKQTGEEGAEQPFSNNLHN